MKTRYILIPTLALIGLVVAWFVSKIILSGSIIDLWSNEAKKQNKKLDTLALRKDMADLSPFDLNLLRRYSESFINRESNTSELLKKIQDSGILKKMNFKPLEGIIFGT